MLDLSALNDRARRAEEVATSGSGNYFRAVAGTHKLRLADKWSGDPFKEFDMNYNLDSTPFTVSDAEYLKSKGWKYYEASDDDHSPRRMLWKKIMPVKRYYANVIDENNPEQGVKVWSMGKKVYQSLLNQAIKMTKDGDDVNDFAFELIVSDQKFTTPTVAFDRKASKCGYDVKEEDLHDIPSQMKYRSNEQIDDLVKNAALNAGVLD